MTGEMNTAQRLIVAEQLARDALAEVRSLRGVVQDVEALRELSAKATGGPWAMQGEHHAGHMIGAFIRSPSGRTVAYVGSDEDVAYVASTVYDAEFVVAAVNVVRAALAAAAERFPGCTPTRAEGAIGYE